MAAPEQDRSHPSLRVLSSRPDPRVFGLPWDQALEDWTEHVVPLPRGLSRHIVRIVSLHGSTYAIKETTEEMAWREYHLLRNLRRLALPTVVPYGVVTGRATSAGKPLPACLITYHLRFALPYRTMFANGVGADQLPLVIDALVVLLVRLHLAGFYWGDVSLSNVLFRRNAGAFAAYLVDAETGELRDELSGGMRDHDVTVGCENVFAELLDLQAGSLVPDNVDPFEIVELLRDRYESLWAELTGAEVFSTNEMWRIEQRIKRLNDLGFDVEELDMVTDWDGDSVRIQPRVVELGHHRRELRDLTGLDVEDNQARELLNDMAAFGAYFDIGGDRQLLASRWFIESYEPLLAMVPPDQRGKLDGPEFFHEVLVHRWYLSEKAGAEQDIFDVARDYIDNVLPTRPDEAVTMDPSVDQDASVLTRE